ncbi:MAG: DegQ family serine endoprotease [Betaproteobacteria bacterium]|nr:DegQ family serine endoprotease [Betaproteobacteria bacterium]MDH3436256.1 DegQ family serine endoprotease [Betaproteobacteria bacterium]
MKRKLIVSSLIAAGIVTALAAGGMKLYEPIVPHANAGAPAVLNAAPAAPIALQALPDFSPLVDAYGPAVVNISVTQTVKAGAEGPNTGGFSEDDPFYEFFRRFQIPMPPHGGTPRQGLGSGFIVSGDGYILTNAHVVRDAADVTVRLTDKREFKAKVVGSDLQTDVAVLKIDAVNLPTVRLGDSKDVRVGEWVVAIGSPYGFDNSVTAGIVSAKGRALPDGTYVPFIQTDVAVNPGNSGGPLFNLKGEVIGINSQIYSRSGGYQGLSFAIPIDLASKIQDQLVRHGKVTRGRIGVTIQEVNQSLAESFGLKQPTGALVGSVDQDGPAAKAGIQPGDVILEIDGKPINRTIDLSSHVADLKPGSSAQLEVWRKGAARQITVTVGEMPGPKLAAASSGDAAAQSRLGVAVRPLSEGERQAAGVKDGLLVEQTAGAAAKAGVQPGDIILALNSTPVKSAEELRTMVGKTGKVAALLVQRKDAKIFIPVDLG